MLDAIDRALSRVLALFLPCRPGRHSAEYLAALAAVAEPLPVSPWSRPWTGPTRAEATQFFQRQDGTIHELRAVQERRRAAVLATLGVGHPYSYPGDQFLRAATRPVAGASE